MTNEPTGPGPRTPTHKLIAEEAGVHPSTVSRILRRQPGPRRADFAETEARVREIAKRLGYRPDFTAASLRTRRSRVIGVLMPRLHDVVLAAILSGIDAEAFRLGYQTIVTNTHGESEQRLERVEMLLSRKVDGLVIGDATLDEGIYGELRRSETLGVLVNHRRAGHVSVTGNDRLGGQLVGEHLLERGHRDIGIIAGPRYPVALDRVQGCVEVYERAGITVASDRIVHTDFDPEGGRRAARQLLEHPRRPSAIFAVNDSAAIGAMGTLRDHGLTVGRDLALVGYNDIAIAQDLPIPLSSVHTPLREMGEVAARQLITMLEGNTSESATLHPALVVRQSSATDFSAGKPVSGDGTV
ncbi:LacI family DNA-binding transcriptional regulator [Actinomadura mexicana]|uniref:Transcriptional regulator, LacI family n=1 Tax=Actinomadura mexicana TaxID=134959 RepID=A0A238XC64_9ACTN|nr:LacI family DNA-binding transcriptional regulator [Actinomadura mexicana]SNR56158.1 transcriptional regulator, LacI family [Actinomadura mexicana]